MIKKLIVGSLIIAATITLAPIGVSAEWKHDSKGSWYTEGDSYATGWRKLKYYGGASWEHEGWYLFGDDGYVKIGWLQDGGNWYYAYSSGIFYIATDRYVDGYYLNSDGILTSDTSNATVKEVAVKATLEIAKKLESLGWIKTGTYLDDRAELTPKTDSENTTVSTRCLINGGVAKVVCVSKLQTFYEWNKAKDSGDIEMSLDDYLKYKSEGRIGSFTYKSGTNDGDFKETVIQEYLRNEPVKTNNTATSTNSSTSGNWHSSDYSKYQTLSEKNQENQNKN